MIPVDDGPRRVRHLPVVTVCLLILNVSVFLYEVSLGAGAEQFIRTYGAVPREILTGQDLPPAGPDPLCLQLLPSMFLHGGWLHLIGNMIYLCIFGDDIEDVLGHGTYLLFYLGAGIAALPAPAEWVGVRRIRVKDAVNCIWWLSKSEWPKADNRQVLQEYSK